MNKGIWVVTIAIAFVAGTLTTGTMAYGAQGGQGDNLIVNAINNLAAVIQGKEFDADVTAEVTIPDGAIVINAPQGPEGPQGIQGIQGPQGPPGPEKIYVKQINLELFGDGAFNYFLTCDAPTDIAIGGGIIDLPDNMELMVSNQDVGPSYNSATWHFVISQSGFSEIDEIPVYVVCASTI